MKSCIMPSARAQGISAWYPAMAWSFVRTVQKSCQQVHQKRLDRRRGRPPVGESTRSAQGACLSIRVRTLWPTLYTEESALHAGLGRESHSPLDRKSGGVDSAGGHRRGGGVLSNSRKDARTLVLRMGGIGTPSARRGGVHPADSFAGH